MQHVKKNAYEAIWDVVVDKKKIINTRQFTLTTLKVLGLQEYLLTPRSTIPLLWYSQRIILDRSVKNGILFLRECSKTV